MSRAELKTGAEPRLKHKRGFVRGPKTKQNYETKQKKKTFPGTRGINQISSIFGLMGVKCQ